jgi:hypothetical protein
MNRRPNPGTSPSTAAYFALAALSLSAGLAFSSRPAAAWSHAERVTFDPSRIALEPATGEAAKAMASGAMRVRYPGSVPGPEGSPDLPRVLVWIEIPAGMRAQSVAAKAEGLRDMGVARVAPVAPDQRGDQAVAPKATPDPAIYSQAKAYPGTWAEIGSQGSLRGHWVVGVLVSPTQWDPESGKLTAASAVALELELAPASAAELSQIAPRTRVVAEIEEKFDSAAGKLVRGFQPAVATESFGDAGSGPAGPGPYQPSFRPTADGSAVEYVIVTSAALATEFQRVADWKTQKGVQSVVRTVETIDQMYPNGVDRAERIRFFIRDAYQNWDTAFVLLGGDSDVIPVRYAQSLFFGGESIPVDYYYGCLDGNWNADGDARFGEGDITGEIADQADFMAEVSVGRAPVSTVSQTDTFIDKLLLYDQNPPASTRYPNTIVVLAERLFPATHGADVAEAALELVPSWVRVARLYEESASYPGSIELTREAAIDSINAGFGIVHHVGHGYRNTMSVGSGTINNSDADNLTNAPRTSIVFAINCSSASIDFNSIGERFVKNANGGSVAYIGTSRVAFISASIPYQNEWYAQVWEDSVRTLGLATDLARLSLLPGSNVDGVNRWNLVATTLIGDPEVDIYTNTVVPIQVSHPSSVALGGAPITVAVTAQGTPVEDATVTLWRAGSVYVRATTGGAGTAQLPITANTTGSMLLTVHKSYYRPYTAPVNVTAATGPYLFVNAVTVDDDDTGASSGDGDGKADAGEVIELRLTLRNGGTVSATSVSADLAESDPLNGISIAPGSVSYGTIAAGGSSQGTGAFVITIAPTAQVAYQPVLTVIADGTPSGPWQDQVVLPLRRPYLEHYSHAVDDQAPRGDGDSLIEAGETIYYRVTLKNTGQDRTTGVTGSLVALHTSNHLPHPLVTVVDANSSFGTILPGAQAQGDRFEFTLAGNCNPATVFLELTLNDDLGPVEVELLDTQLPSPPDSITAFGSPTSIRLTWKKPTAVDLKGYDLLRSMSPGGPFTRINAYTADGTATYEDPNLAPLTRYYYQVVSRDSSYNASVPSAVVSGTTNPPFANGWPIEMAQQSSSSGVIADIDGGPHNELVCGGEMVNAWHGDGTEVVDGDQDPRTNGPLSLHGLSLSPAGFPATPAVGDVTNDGQGMEITNVSFARDSLFLWNKVGLLLPGWPRWVMDDLNWGSPLMADLNNDGDLEIVVWAAKGGRLFAWHHTGVEVADGDQIPSTNGVLTRITGISFNYGSAAVANLDPDPQLEILVPVNHSPDNSGGIYAVNIDGSAVLGWPFFTGNVQNFSQVSSSIAVGDVDRNGTDEVVVSCERDGGTIYVLNRDGSVRAGWPKLAAAHTPDARLPSPSLADVNNDGFLDIVFPTTNGQLFVWDRNGNVLPGFPVTYYPAPTTQSTQCTASIGDVDGNGDLEIFFGDEKGRVHGYNHNGSLAAGFPIQLPGEVRSTPALWDLDRDGLMEIAVVCFDTNVYVWDMTGAFNPLNLPWPFFRHDTRNTGRYITPVQQVGVEEPPSVPLVSVPAFHPVHPNPFNPHAVLAFDVPGVANGARPVMLDIYDVRGRLVRRLLDGPVATGRHEMIWDGRAKDGGLSASGIYFAKITIADFTATQKLTLLK